MSMHNTDTVNVSAKKHIYTDNDNVGIGGDKYTRSKQVEMLAHKLADKLSAQEWYTFYCKVAYKLPEATIWKLYEQATCEKARARKNHNAAKLFYWLCDRAMQ